MGISKNNRELTQAKSESKVHYRMYKAGRFWLYAGVALTAISVGVAFGEGNALADTVDSTQTTSTPVSAASGVGTSNESSTQPSTYVAASSAASSETVPAANQVSSLGGDTTVQGSATNAKEEFTAQSETTNATPINDNGYSQLTTDAQDQVGYVTANDKIDFTQDFTINGTVTLGDKSKGGGDGLTFVFSPDNPTTLTNNETGGYLGMQGLEDAFGLAIDEHYNSDSAYGDFDNRNAMSDPAGMATYQGVISWRTTDSDGNLNSNALIGGISAAYQNAKSKDPNAQVVSINKSIVKDNAEHIFTISYNAATSMLTITLPDNNASSNQVYKNTGATSGYQWTRVITANEKATGMYFSVAAATGDDTNKFALRITDYTFSKKTSSVTFTAQDENGQQIPGQNYPAVTAIVGDTINVYGSQSDAQAAISSGAADADSTVIAPFVAGYHLQQNVSHLVSGSDNIVLVYVVDNENTVPTVQVEKSEGNETAGYIVSGVATPNSTIAVVDTNSGSTKTVSVASDGTFTTLFGANEANAGDTIKVTPSKTASTGKTLTGEPVYVTLTQGDSSSSQTSGLILPNVYTVGDDSITGVYTGDVSYAQLVINGAKTGILGGTFANGSFSFWAKNNVQAGQTVQLIAYDKDGKELDTKSVSVNKAPTTGTLTPNDYTAGNDYVTGAYTGDVDHAELVINGKVVSSGGTFGKNGQFNYWAKDTINAGDTAQLNAYDVNGKLLDSKTISVAKPATSGTITPATYTEGSDQITGSYTGDVSYTRLIINGADTGVQGGVFSNGQFTFWAKDTVKAGQSVQLQAYDKDGKLLDTKTVSVNAKATSGTITPATYTEGSDQITGSYTGDVSYARLIINGADTGVQGGAFSNGQFTFWAKDTVKAGQSVQLQAYDKNGNLLDTKSVSVNGMQDSGSITIPNVYNVNSDTSISGNYTGNVAYVKTFVNGNLATIGGDFINGQFTAWVGPNKVKTGDKLTIEAYSSNYNLVDTETVKLSSDSETGTIVLSPFKADSSDYLTGTYSGDVNYLQLVVNGKVISTSTSLNTDGTFSYYIGQNKVTPNDDVVLNAYSSNYQLLDSKAVQVTNSSSAVSGTITSDPYSVSSDDTIKLHLTGSVNYVKLLVNGQQYSVAGNLPENMDFDYYIGKNNLSATDKLVFEAYSKDYQLLATYAVQVLS